MRVMMLTSHWRAEMGWTQVVRRLGNICALQRTRVSSQHHSHKAELFQRSCSRFTLERPRSESHFSWFSPIARTPLHNGNLKAEKVFLFPQFDGFSYILFIFSATPTPPSVFPLVPCCTKTGNAPPDTSLACLVTGYFPSPVEIKWNSGKVTQGVTTFPEVTMSNGRFTQSSLLIIPARSRQGNTNQCDVTHQGTATILLKKFPQEGKTPGCVPCTPAVLGSLDPTIYLTKPSYEDVIINSGHVTCLVLGYDSAASRITWKVDGQVSSAAKTEPPKKNSNGTTSLVSPHPMSLVQWGQGTQFTCKVTTPWASPAPLQRPNVMINQHPLEVSLLPPSLKDLYIVQNTTITTITCLASGFQPRDILVTWTQQDRSVPLEAYTNVGPVREAGKEERYFIYSKLSVLASEWERGDTYACVVGHEGLPMTFIHQSVDKASAKPTAVNVSVILSYTDITCY
uniref:Ig-like domain-containing protein n=1 Tax=Chelonoidis abingdonii TaxID=106734 RepID=A0A8C0H2F2_CHEAB